MLAKPSYLFLIQLGCRQEVVNSEILVLQQKFFTSDERTWSRCCCRRIMAPSAGNRLTQAGQV